MSTNDKQPIRIGNTYFVEVTNETCTGEIFSLKEAIIYGTTGKRICSND